MRFAGTPRRRWRLLSSALLLLAGALALARFAPEAGGQSSQALSFTDWSAVEGNVASGTLLGAAVSLSGSHVGPPPASVVDGSSPMFAQAFFSPPLATSDAIEFYGFQGYSYVLQFGAPVRDPVLHLASLASALAFPADTQVTKLSGESTFVVSGSTVTGALNGSTDANGSVMLPGTFTSIPFSATPVFGPSTEDGIDIQVGARALLPGSPPPPEPRTLADLPAPVVGRIVNVEPVKGDVLIAIPVGAGRPAARAAQKGLRFVPLREARQIPVGSFLDTRRGTVRLQSAADRSGRRQAGDFDAGLFQVSQVRAGKRRGLTELRLKGSTFRGCRARRSAATLARRSRRVIRRLRGNARGRFATRGRYSSATVRGTQWSTTDRCDGTLTAVRSGRVVVRDLRRRRNIVLRARGRHLARAPG